MILYMNEKPKLDERYFCTRTSTKTQLLDAINSFINHNPNFCPKSYQPLCGKDIQNYCKINGYIILDENFVASQVPSQLRSQGDYCGYFNDIAIVVDNKKTKKILVKRSNGQVKEISSLLSVNTLYIIWLTFVDNVISYSYAWRKYKMMKDEIESLNQKSDIVYYTKGSLNASNKDIELVSIQNINMNMYKREVSYKKIIYCYNRAKTTFCVSSVSNLKRSLSSFNDLIKCYKSKDNITINELKTIIQSHYAYNINLYSTNLKESMQCIDSIINN